MVYGKTRNYIETSSGFFYNKRWKKAKHKWKEKLGGCCSVCGSQTHLELHHIDKNRKNNKLSNLVLLCRKHHRAVHKSYLK